jgi:CPA2 family monovalent cation:H+ antiporter-2
VTTAADAWYRHAIMDADPLFFRDLGYVFVAAVMGATVAWAARQPLILGYVAAGILIGPFTPGPTVADLHTFELFAEIGVVLLMFSIGMEFSLRDLLRVKWVGLLGGPLGILLSTLLAVGLGALIGWPILQSVVIGLIISVASTMVLARFLIDRGELRSEHGRVMIGITLVEDLAVVVLTVLLPAFGTIEPGRLVAIGNALIRAAAILVPFAYLSTKVIPTLMTRVARTQNSELLLMVALAIGLGTAALTQAVGLSLALGAFLAGLLISGSDYAHETLDRLSPLRDAFVALFFVTMGALIDPASIARNLPLLAGMCGLILIGKLVVWSAVVLLFQYPLRTALLVGIGLTQIGEFSFILVQAARSVGHVGDDVYNATLAASLVTILINAPLSRLALAWLGSLRLRRRAMGDRSAPVDDRERIRDHVALCGFGRVGSAVGEALDTFAVPYMVIEQDPDVVRALRARGVPAVFGDASRRTVLAAAGVDRAMLAIVALPDIEPARFAVRSIRAMNPRVEILARAHGSAEAESLRALGATSVIQPEVEAAATLIRRALATVRLPKDATLAYLDRFIGAMDTADKTERPTSHPLPEVREVTLAAGPLADQSLREARIRERFGVTIVSVSREDGPIVNPPAETMLRPGDVVRVFGLPAQIVAFADEACRSERG